MGLVLLWGKTCGGVLEGVRKVSQATFTLITHNIQPCYQNKNSFWTKTQKPAKRTRTRKWNRFVIHISLLFLAILCYIISLKKCPYDRNNRCLDWLFKDKMFHRVALAILISAIIYAYFVIAIFIWKTIPKLFGFLLILPSLLFLFSLGHRTQWDEHGGVSRAIVTLVIIMAVIITFSYKLYLKLSFAASRVSGINVHRVRSLIVFVISICCLFEFKNRQIIGSRNFYASPNPMLFMNHSDQENELCKFYPPKVFMLDLVSGFLNLAALSSCRFSNSLDWLPSSLKSAAIIGFPLTNNLSSDLLSEMPDLWKYMQKRMRNCSQMSQCPELETFVHRNGPGHGPQMTVRVTRNSTLVLERLGRILRNKTKSRPNVLILFIDALSRPGFTRKMPKSFELLKNWNRNQKMRVTPFFRFSSYAAFTEPNMFPFTFGIRRLLAESISKRIADYPRPESYFKRAADVGYVTGYLATSCQAEDFEWKPYLPLPIEYQDHRLMFCDPNFIDVNDPWNPAKGPYSAFKRCLYGRHVHEYAFDYAKLFWTAYPDLPKMFKLHLSEAHESTAEHVTYMDEHMRDFLLHFEQKGWLNNTVVIIMSDHGNHMHGILKVFHGHSISRIETHDPLLVFATPPNLGSEQAMNHNAQQLVSMFDVRYTVLELTGSNTSSPFPGPPQANLLQTKLSTNRTCDLLGVSKGVCRC